MEQASAPNIFINAYRGAPRGREYEAWREETCRRFCGLDIRPSDGDNIDCRLQISRLHSLALAVPDGSSARFSRTRETLGDGCDDLVLVAATAGRILVMQDGRPIELAQSQMCLADMSVLGTVCQSRKGQFKTTRIPRSVLLAASPEAEDQLSLVLGDNAPLREIIARYHVLAADLAPRLDTVGQQLMAQHLVDLMGLLLGTGAHNGGEANRGYAAARFDLMRADMLANLSRGDLTIAAFARRSGLSARQAQRLFEQAGTTFTDFILEQRLLLARSLLLDPLRRWRKISDIAHSSGFSDLSYFNRAFRRRFGATPSDIRGR